MCVHLRAWIAAYMPPSVCTEPGWRITFEDEFEGSALNQSNWAALDNATHGWSEKQLYMADDVYVRDGVLRAANAQAPRVVQRHTRLQLHLGLGRVARQAIPGIRPI